MKKPRALTAAELKRFPLPPVEDGDKHEHGRLLIIAGSRDVAGAPLLTALSAMRAGTGKLKIATVATGAPQLAIAMPEAMVKGLPEARDGGFTRSAVTELVELASEVDAVVAGPGMTSNRATEALAAQLAALGKPLALDAALLHALPEHHEEARDSRISPILLPHSGEMASLLGCEAADVEADPAGCGRDCSRRYDAFVLVKGATSHIVSPEGEVWKFNGGSPGLGVSGSGDTLAGIVGGLLARGTDPLTALLWSVWLHGQAGQSLSKKVGPVGFLARELADEIPGLLARAS